MSIRSDPLDELVVPDGTTVEFGVRGHNVVAGERVRFGGNIEAEGDCRLDMWSDVAGDVLVGDNAYLGERVHVGGQLKVAGDLDIGDDVDIEEGFEASGWIVIRNPMPTVVFLVVYLSTLLRVGEEEAAEEVMAEVVDDEGPESPLLVPRGATVDDDAWKVSTPATVGDGCRLHGNIRAESIDLGADNNVFGSLRARGDVSVGADSRVHGDVTTRTGTVTVEAGARVLGDVACENLRLHDGAEVDGTIRAREDMRIVREAPKPVE